MNSATLMTVCLRLLVLVVSLLLPFFPIVVLQLIIPISKQGRACTLWYAKGPKPLLVSRHGEYVVHG